jgi:hypothetical protein
MSPSFFSLQVLLFLYSRRCLPHGAGARGSTAAEQPKTWVHDIFEGVLTNETKCMHCETVRTRDECFLDLSVDIEQNTSISACLRSLGLFACL